MVIPARWPPDLPTLREAAYGPPGTALISIQMPAASYLPWGRENLGMGEGNLAQEIRRDLTLSPWLNYPQCIEALYIPPILQMRKLSPQQRHDQDKSPAGSAIFTAPGLQKGHPDLVP